MANAKTSTKQAEPKKEPVYVEKYTVNELAEAAKTAFKTDKVIVLAALTAAGKDSYSMDEATRIVTNFRNKEVTK